MKFQRLLPFGCAMLAVVCCAATASAAPDFGKISGVVVDGSGTPQMGATVTVAAEDARLNAPPRQILTNDRGAFSAERLLPGLYTVRVTLAGFLPALQRHVRIDSSLTTMLRVEMDSVFSSLDRLRRQPGQKSEEGDWTWVLRTSSSTRPVLRYSDGEIVVASDATQEENRRKNPHGRLELTAGARRPGSASNVADAPGTAFAYEQRVNSMSAMVFAGQASYERAASAGFAALWLPTGMPGLGPQTTIVMRRADLGPDNPVFRGVRLDHSNQLPLGDRIYLRYGTEFVMVGLGTATSTLRPRGELGVRLDDSWVLTIGVSPRPLTSSEVPGNALESALYALDSFPAIFLRDGRPVLEGGWHEEISVRKSVGGHTTIVASVFRDRASHTAIFGRGEVSGPDFLQDYYSNTFSYDGGASSSWGTRLAVQQKLSEDFEAALVYSWAGALMADPELSAAGLPLRDMLRTRRAHSLAARVSGRIPRYGTRVTASYKWLSREAVTRQDAYGEARYQMDPYLNVSVRQPLPRLFFPGRIEAQAEIRNLLAQGYVPCQTADGMLLIIPTARAIRGGFTFQF